MVSLTVTVTGLEKPIEVFTRLGLGDWYDLMKVVGETMYLQTMRHFAGKYGPDGGWAPLSEATLAGVMGKPGRAQGTMLIDSGALRGSVNQIVGPLSAEVGTDLFYGKFHQFGTGPTGPNHIFSGIPARAFVGLAGGEEDEIKTVVETYIAKLVGD